MIMQITGPLSGVNETPFYDQHNITDKGNNNYLKASFGGIIIRKTYSIFNLISKASLNN